MLKDLVATEPVSTEHHCAGCGAQIRDRYLLLAVDRAWHGQCLRCCRCSQTLDTEFSCFAREGNIYCKEDYYRLFSSRRCARCGTGLGSSELVMRARELVFHVNCFTCILCGAPLSTGDTAALRNGRLFCVEHYDADIIGDTNTIAAQFFPGSPQKGRPRKRKSLTLQQTETTGGDMGRGTPMRMDLLHSELPTSSIDLSSYDGSQSPRSGGSLTPQTRTKRMRTSFKHHQLRTMKSYFAINQNPDAKDLKQLAQKTGLSKRVLQVWFQNARAKWRRNVMRQEGGVNNGGPSSGNNQISVPGGQLLGNGSIQSITSGGPPSVQSTNSSNMESSGIGTPSHALEEMHHMTFAELY